MWVCDGTAPSGADIGSKITHINFNASLKLYATTYHSKVTAKKNYFPVQISYLLVAKWLNDSLVLCFML